jgi:transposase
MTVGANRAGVETCWTCYREASDRRIRERGARIERLWKEGASLKEIAAELGWSTGHLKTEMGRLRASGRADLPRRRGRRVTEAVRHG